MVTKGVPGLLIATPDAAQAGREAAGRMIKTVREAIRDHGQAHIALSGGNSPFDAYRLLAAESFDWNKIHVWFVDERCVPPDHERSNFSNAKKALIDVAKV